MAHLQIGDPPLSTEGWEEAESLALPLKEEDKVVAILSSTAARCLQTAAPLFERFLGESGSGIEPLRGLTDTRNQMPDGTLVEADGPVVEPPGFLELQQRAIQALEKFFNNFLVSGDEVVAVVTHRTVIAAIMAFLQGITAEEEIGKFMGEHYVELAQPQIIKVDEDEEGELYFRKVN